MERPTPEVTLSNYCPCVHTNHLGDFDTYLLANADVITKGLETKSDEVAF